MIEDNSRVIPMEEKSFIYTNPRHIKPTDSNFNPPEVECVECGDKIKSQYPGHFISCDCGAISVDSTQYYTRYIGDLMSFKHIRDSKIDNNSTNKD